MAKIFRKSSENHKAPLPNAGIFITKNRYCIIITLLNVKDGIRILGYMIKKKV